jgi:hypothetical protein
MLQHFESICYHLFSPSAKTDSLPVFNPVQQFTDASKEPAGMVRQLNAAFLILLAGSKHPQFDKAQAALHRATHSDEWSLVAQFYLSAKDRIRHEIEKASESDPDLADRIKNLSRILDSRRGLGWHHRARNPLTACGKTGRLKLHAPIRNRSLTRPGRFFSRQMSC